MALNVTALGWSARNVTRPPPLACEPCAPGLAMGGALGEGAGWLGRIVGGRAVWTVLEMEGEGAVWTATPLPRGSAVEGRPASVDGAKGTIPGGVDGAEGAASGRMEGGALGEGAGREGAA